MVIRRTTSFVYTLLVLAIVEPIATSGARSERELSCGYKNVSIVSSRQSDLNMACRALDEIVKYFSSLGFRVTPGVLLRFADRSTDRAFVHGYYDARQSRIVVYRNSKSSPWGLPWNKDMTASFLRHELVHMAILQIINTNRISLRREWHEFIAYAIQLDYLPPRLKEDLLSKQSQVRPFGTFLQINEFTSRMNPEVFAVASYKTYRAKGAGAFVRQLLRAEIVPAPISYPFAFGPGEMSAD